MRAAGEILLYVGAIAAYMQLAVFAAGRATQWWQRRREDHLTLPGGRWGPRRNSRKWWNS